MKLRALKSAALAVALSVGAAAPVFAQTEAPPKPSHEGHGQMRGREGRHFGQRGGHLGGLELTDAQQTQLRQIHEGHREATRALREEIRAKRQEVHRLSAAATFDEAAVRAKLTEIAALEAKLLGEQVRVRQEAQSILTPEQRTQLEQRKQERMQRFQERKQHFRERKSAQGERSV